MTGATDLDWMEDAACAGVDVNVFYPTGNDGRADPLAVALCRSCPVRARCLEYGLSDGYGIFGGMTVAERRRLPDFKKRDVSSGPRSSPTWHASKVQPCGTFAAYRRHMSRGEPVDAPCLSAMRAAMRQRRAPR